MLILVSGGAASGKSEYAEGLILQSGLTERLYVATMEVWGDEDRRKVERHRKQRAGKGFHTIERPRGLEALRIPGSPEQTAVLLECVSNLAANEMFGGETLPDCGQERAVTAGEAVVDGIRSLARQAAELVVVTNEVGLDGISYEVETMEYIRLMGRVNQRLAKLADRVVEVVYGIPVVLKENGAAGQGGGI